MYNVLILLFLRYSGCEQAMDMVIVDNQYGRISLTQSPSIYIKVQISHSPLFIINDSFNCLNVNKKKIKKKNNFKVAINYEQVKYQTQLNYPIQHSQTKSKNCVIPKLVCIYIYIYIGKRMTHYIKKSIEQVKYQTSSNYPIRQNPKLNPRIEVFPYQNCISTPISFSKLKKIAILLRETPAFH